jgi:hypothetical protein
MCRNIKPLFNFEPTATDEEIRASSLQFVRKDSSTNKPSVANATAFERCVGDVEIAVKQLLDSLATSALPKNREVEAERSRARSARRFAS